MLQNSTAAVPEDTASFDGAKVPNTNTGVANTGRGIGHFADALDYNAAQNDPKTAQTKRETIETNKGKASRLSSGFEFREFDEEKLFEKYAIKTVINDIPF